MRIKSATRYAQRLMRDLLLSLAGGVFALLLLVRPAEAAAPHLSWPAGPRTTPAGLFHAQPPVVIAAGSRDGRDVESSRIPAVAGAAHADSTPIAYAAAVLVWDGGGTTNNWSEAANWSGDLVPGTADVATFNGTSTKSVTIDASVNVAGINVGAGYAGSIIQVAGANITVGASGYAQAAGTFSGDASATPGALDINNGSFTLSGGTFISTVGSFTVERSFTLSGGSFTSAGTLTFDGADGTDDSVLTCGGALGGTVGVNKTSSGATFTLASGCAVELGSSPSTSSGAFTNNGSLSVSGGSWTHNGLGATLTNNGSLSHSGSGWDLNDAGLVNNSGGSISYAGPALSIERGFTQAGSFDLTGKVLTFDGANSADDSVLTCGGALGGTVGVNKTSSGATFTLASGCAVELGSSPSTSSGAFTNNGSLSVSGGSWTHNGLGATLTNNGSLSHSGSGWDLNDAGLVNNSGGSISYAGPTLSIERSFTQAGSFDLTGKVLTFDGANGADDSVLTCGGALGGTVGVNKTNSGATFTLASDCTIAGDFIRTDGVVANPGAPYSLTLEGNFSMSSSDAFGGANLVLQMVGTNTQAFTQTAGSFNSPLTVNKSSGAVTLTSNAGIGGLITIVSGSLSQGASYDLTASGGLSVGAGGILSNTGTGDLILGGPVVSDGTITLDAGGNGAGGPDAIFIRSTLAGSQRAWSGGGSFGLFDLDIQDMTVGSTPGSLTCSSCTDSGNNTNWLFPTPALAISKLDGPDPVTAGGSLTYTLKVQNTGSDSATGSVIADTIPTYATFASADFVAPAAGTVSGPGAGGRGPVTWTLAGALAAGDSALATLVVSVGSPLPNGTLITNAGYSVGSNETAPVTGPDVTTTVASGPVLEISKLDGPDPVTAGGNLTYILKVKNTGSDSATGSVIADTIPTYATFASADFVAPAAGTVSGPGTGGRGPVTWALAGALAVGDSALATLVVSVDSPLPNGTPITNAGYSVGSNETAPVTGPDVTTSTNALARIGGFVWEDYDGDGIQELGEPGIGGAGVKLLACGGGGELASTVTGAGGGYVFDNLAPGCYRVQVELPAGFDGASPANAGSDDLVDSDGSGPSPTSADIPLSFGSEDLSVDFGFFRSPPQGQPQRPGRIEGFIWHDVDSDGVQDPAEPGIPGAAVSLLTCAGEMAVAVSLSDAGGTYLFDDLTPGCYRVRVPTPAGFDGPAPADMGGDDARDSDGTGLPSTSGDLAAGPAGEGRTADFGFVRHVSPLPPPPPVSGRIGDFVWHDLDGDGVQDLGEPGIQGAQVQLLGCDSGSGIGSTATNASGNYLFDGLAPGCYRILVTPPRGPFGASPANVGSDEAVDSDGAGAAPISAQVLLSAETADLTVDFGFSARALAFAENPAGGTEVEIRYSAPATDRTRVLIFKATGELVRRFDNLSGPTGSLRWQFDTDEGRPIANGTYIVLLEAGGFQARANLAVVR